jgi:hypothetical protein
MTIEDKLVLLTELCEQYNLHFVDLTVWHGHEWAYIGSHYDPSSYIEKLSSDQIESMDSGQIEELVVQCTLVEMASGHGQD